MKDSPYFLSCMPCVELSSLSLLLYVRKCKCDFLLVYVMCLTEHYGFILAVVIFVLV